MPCDVLAASPAAGTCSRCSICALGLSARAIPWDPFGSRFPSSLALLTAFCFLACGGSSPSDRQQQQADHGGAGPTLTVSRPVAASASPSSILAPPLPPPCPSALKSSRTMMLSSSVEVPSPGGMSGLGGLSVAARNVVRSSSISGAMYSLDKSPTGGGADSASLAGNKKRRSSLGAKMVAIVGLSQWSKSTQQLNQQGSLSLLGGGTHALFKIVYHHHHLNSPKSHRVALFAFVWLHSDGGEAELSVTVMAMRRARSFRGQLLYSSLLFSCRQQGYGGTKKLRSTIRRSTETGIAVEMRNRVTRQGSKDSTDGSTNSNSSDGTFVFPTTRLGPESQFSDFLDGLGPAQIVGRQTLATPSMDNRRCATLTNVQLPTGCFSCSLGDVHVGMVDRGGQLEVEVNQARGLTPKPGSKNIPATYVKVYVLENGMCLAKKKTKVVKKTLDPTYQQALLFDESPQGKVLQVIVWGDYGRMDHKCFMGMAQILLEDLDLSATVSGWYKLFPTSSLADPSIGPLTRRLSQSSLESATSPSCT
ncbi:unnamed protein product [Menidia menidia]|uniref:(Atlantic silverside) hypothetical protein n=1 Tax=Menidia menidia TaxID=238744 RepID=A0A8S4ASW3_9TELE|nr:unnamed protein product [Menidia menidia]